MIGRMRSGTKTRTRVALVYGGRSAERDVSLMSARNVAAALDGGKYELILIGIDAEGRWNLASPEPQAGVSALRDFGRRGAGSRVALTPDGAGRELVVKGTNASLGEIDVIFPMLHGPCGEDGSIQGLARLADLPCVGADVLGSALCMDKDAAKRILRDSGIAVAPFSAFHSIGEAEAAWPELGRELGDDLFVKPANLGSSVGVSRSRSREEYDAALALAFEYDVKVLVERTMVGREIEVAVLGGRDLRASLPGEILPRDGFYSYEAKYIDEDGAALLVPAPLSDSEASSCSALALAACRSLCVRGMARVDMFLCPGGLVVNEVNTIPGFTERSMYPLLWEASGLPLPRLVDELVELAFEFHAERVALRSSPPAIY
jgi:D-alanine-D-alanine ligase